MILKGFVAWMVFCHQVTCRPLSSEMLTEDDQVTRCIVEVISDTLSSPRPLPVTAGCSKVLKEDERVLAMVLHQNLLRELEELTQPVESSVKQMPLKNDKKWNYPMAESMEWNEEDNLEKRLASLKEEGGDEWREPSISQGGSHVKMNTPSKEEGEVKRNGQGQEVKNEEQRKDKDLITGEDGTKVGARASEEEFSDEDKGGFGKGRGELSEEDYQSAIELGQEGREDLRVDELIEKVAKQELESREDEEEEEERKEREGGVPRRNGNGIGQPNASKRVEENASDEETDQFEAEQEGLKILEAQSHALGNVDQQQPREDKRRHHLDTKKRREDDVVYQWKKHRGLGNGKVEAVDEEGEEGEGEQERKLKHEEHELSNLAEIERELKDVADKLRDIQRG
ncbi:chromogranin-A-like isoform X2 [Amblyraja radiata]|uniref:chromogranin-A-like isoform X2 n=1 Tax=Amblyraja radiata TaxID=386614 RepID=UPI001403D06A|nr:chromogranin-A-like isoform X2 [Amblyraja radiata]